MFLSFLQIFQVLLLHWLDIYPLYTALLNTNCEADLCYEIDSDQHLHHDLEGLTFPLQKQQTSPKPDNLETSDWRYCVIS